MDIKSVKSVVGDTVNMTVEQAQRMATHIRENDVHDILELGFQHGVSTSYMAAVLDEVGTGHITSIDRLKPERVGQEKIEQFLGELGLRDRVTIHYEPAGYLWRMLKMLQESPEPRFDLCYLDGAHSWAVDGFAFFLVDRLLRPGGWIIFDDLDWTFGDSPTLRGSEFLASMSQEERDIPQVRQVYEVLVKTHAGYDSFRVEDNWAYARKIPTADARRPGAIRTEVVVERYGIGESALKLAHIAKNRIAAARASVKTRSGS